MEPDDYASLGFWGAVLQEAVQECQRDYVVSILRDFDLTTCEGVRDLAQLAVCELRTNRTRDTQDALYLWQISQCLKKFRYGCTASPEEMQQGWVRRNEACKTMVDATPEWVLAEMAKLLSPLDPLFLSAGGQGRFGNGAVFEKLTVIGRWNRIAWFPYNVRDPESICEWRDQSSNVARLSCVPKDMFKLRSITVEPAEATFLQQFYRTRLITAAAFGLPYSTAIPQQAWGGGPELQRRRALAGSLDGLTATIDLSDASDSIRYWDVMRVFPPAIGAALERSRTPYVEVGGTRFRCHMYAGMGNATTFIVETLFFWALFTVLSHWVRDFTPVSVFGDDIVIGIKAATHPLVQEILVKMGITVNVAKSGLSTGPGFREACGLVAYQGAELPLLRIQGYRVEKPEELVSLCEFLNDALDPDSRYAPIVRTMAARVATRLVKDIQCPILPLRPVQAGCYIVDPSETVGGWSYRSRWDASRQHSVVKVKVLKPHAGKTVRVRDLTPGEALGVLNGQLHTDFYNSRVGTRGRKYSTFQVPGRGFRFEEKWVTVWGSDSQLSELTRQL